MNFNDETLMAYADGELDASTRRAIEEAMRHDDVLAQRVARHRMLRTEVFNAFAPVLDEPMPERLLASLTPIAPHNLAVEAGTSAISLGIAGTGKPAANDAHGWSWSQWGAMAATLVIGVVVGHFATGDRQTEQQVAMVSGRNGMLTAQGALDAALSRQLPSDTPAGAAVRIGLSFVSADGNYCRSFTLQGQTASTAGLACKNGEKWEIPAIAQGETPIGAYRTAAAETPAAVLDAIDRRIAGKTLDAAGEQTAMRQGWQRQRH